MSTKTKRLIIAGIVVLLLSTGFLYFVRTPGFVLSGIRDVAPNSNVRITVYTYTPHRDGSYGGSTRTDYALNSEQVTALRDLFRGSWYSLVMMNIMRPALTHVHNSYIIHGDHGVFSINHRGYVGRMNARTIRIHNADWEAALQEILAMTE